MVNDSSTQEALEKSPHTKVTTTEMSDRAQNPSSRQALMASIKVRRFFIKSTVSSSDMNLDSAVLIEDALVLTA